MPSSKELREQERYRRWLGHNIHNFVQALGYRDSITWQQEQLFETIMRGYKRVAIKSGQGAGKDWSTAIVGLWLSIKDVNSKVILTAPSLHQCSDVWLSQARKHIQENPHIDPRVKPFFNFTATTFSILGKPHNVWGCQTVVSKSPEGFAGLHDENMHIISDEASGIGDDVHETCEGTLSNPKGIWIQISNPTKREGYYYNIFNKPSMMRQWLRLTWNSEETPESAWFTQEKNRKIAENYGRNSDIYRYRVLGEFPLTDGDALVTEEQIYACMDKRLLDSQGYALKNNTKQFGMDFAGYGGDENVVYVRQGNAIVDSWFKEKCDPTRARTQAYIFQEERGWDNRECMFIFDAGGMGYTFRGLFAEENRRTYPIDHAGVSSNPQYANKVTELYFKLAKKIIDREIYIPEDTRIVQQIVNRKFVEKPVSGMNKLILESKELYKKRMHESPDRGDAVAYVAYDPPSVRF